MCVGFLYTEVVRLLLHPRETRVSKKGMEPLSLELSTVNCNMRVNGINVVEKLLAMFCLLDYKGVTHIPEPRPGRLGVVLMTLDLMSSMNRLVIKGPVGEPMAAPWTCSK